MLGRTLMCPTVGFQVRVRRIMCSPTVCFVEAPPTLTLLSLKWVATNYTFSTLDDLLAAFFPVQLREKKCRKHLFSLEKNLHLYKGLILFGKKEEERKKNEQVFPPKMLCTVASKEILNLSKLNIPPPVISPYSTSTSDCTFYFRWTWTSFECRLVHIQILVSLNPTCFKSCTKNSRYVHFISTSTYTQYFLVLELEENWPKEKS